MLAVFKGPGYQRLGKPGAAYKFHNDIYIRIVGQIGGTACQNASFRQDGGPVRGKVAYQHLAQHDFPSAAAADHFRILFQKLHKAAAYRSHAGKAYIQRPFGRICRHKYVSFCQPGIKPGRPAVCRQIFADKLFAAKNYSVSLALSLEPHTVSFLSLQETYTHCQPQPCPVSSQSAVFAIPCRTEYILPFCPGFYAFADTFLSQAAICRQPALCSL